MIETVAYLAIGFVIALAILVAFAYHDTGNPLTNKGYIAAGVVGMMMAVLWPLVVPVVVYSVAVWYVKENYNQTGN